MYNDTALKIGAFFLNKQASLRPDVLPLPVPGLGSWLFPPLPMAASQ